MVLLVHKESKSTNEFTRFYSELGEFLACLIINCLMIGNELIWTSKFTTNSLTYEQLKKSEYFNFLIHII